jgi:hypothetical protein
VSKFTTKKFYEIDPWCQLLLNFLGIIYDTINTFPYDFDQSYANSGIYYAKKSFITLATGPRFQHNKIHERYYK